MEPQKVFRTKKKIDFHPYTSILELIYSKMEQNKSKRRLKKLLKHISIHNECTPLNTSSNLNQFEDEDFVISPEVKDALRQNIPVVALESTGNMNINKVYSY